MRILLTNAAARGYNKKRISTGSDLPQFYEEAFMADKSGALTYKGHPLRRKDNLIYYGSMADKYIVMIQVMSSEQQDGLDMANKVHLQLQFTDPELKSRDRVVKKSDLPDLFSAIDMGSIWLMRALAGK